MKRFAVWAMIALCVAGLVGCKTTTTINLGAALAEYGRRVLLGAEVLQALASLLLLLDLVAGTFVTWHLYALTALQAAGAALQEPALLATTTQLVPLAQRTRANALGPPGWDPLFRRAEARADSSCAARRCSSSCGTSSPSSASARTWPVPMRPPRST